MIVRHTGSSVHPTLRENPSLTSHANPPLAAADTIWNVCTNVPDPQLVEQLPLTHWPIQSAAEPAATAAAKHMDKCIDVLFGLLVSWLSWSVRRTAALLAIRVSFEPISDHIGVNF